MQKACVSPGLLVAWSRGTENLNLYAGRFAGVQLLTMVTLWHGQDLLVQLL